MSAKLFKSDILFLQRILGVSGFYTGPFDGKFSAAVDAAELAFEKDYEATKKAQGAFDSRTEGNIRTLVPKAQKAARDFMNATKGLPLSYRIISGTRTYAEQDALFAIGRTVQKSKKKVTNAQGGESNHNFGIAWDVGIFDGGEYLDGDTPKEDKKYVELGALITAKVPSIEWGGNWTTFVDKPHYQLKLGKTVKQLRKLLEKGTPF